jgi:hypothetical protein
MKLQSREHRKSHDILKVKNDSVRVMHKVMQATFHKSVSLLTNDFGLMNEQYQSDNLSYLISSNQKKKLHSFAPAARQKIRSKNLHRRADDVLSTVINIYYTFPITTTRTRRFGNCFLLQPNLNQP